MNIGLMGAAVSFSEQAGETYVLESALTDAAVVPLVTVELLLGALSKGEIDTGDLPNNEYHWWGSTRSSACPG